MILWIIPCYICIQIQIRRYSAMVLQRLKMNKKDVGEFFKILIYVHVFFIWLLCSKNCKYKRATVCPFTKAKRFIFRRFQLKCMRIFPKNTRKFRWDSNVVRRASLIYTNIMMIPSFVLRKKYSKDYLKKSFTPLKCKFNVTVRQRRQQNIP